ncbi:hypothetical protein AbraIFM66951_004537 [Aspergillus brasiliensis]|uniref:Glutamine amidotransferase domain-containing protein n=1 Tax=Aspergillus brasiliensis TaxID=319629 RepID=A0A9W5Z0I6_9EURO|nr:hypothetical protein AbraCBS73388_003711 [Aspergillus brasiliensis]GKZ50845.1 hypothetical protein AbraIFM66951_004537 [Aspergillus brasiliensis]
MKRHLHLAILDADIPARGLFDARGLYSAQFRKILQAATSRLNASNLTTDKPIDLFVSAWDIHGESYPPYDRLHRPTAEGAETTSTTSTGSESGQPIGAILITGSAPGVYEIDQYPWMRRLEEYIKTVFRKYPHVRILGSCFGHQLIAKALLPEGSSADQFEIVVEKCPLGREVGIYAVQADVDFASAFPVLDRLPRREMRMQMMHGDRVLVYSRREQSSCGNKTVSLPQPWKNVGSTSICPIQGLYYPQRVLTLQGHLELDAFAMTETCREFGRLLGWSQAELGLYLQQVGPDVQPRQDDAETIAEALICFLAGIEV